MSRATIARRIPILLMTLGSLAVMGMVWFGSVQRASAQCGTGGSACKTCHETQKELPVSGNAAWHSGEHASFDCSSCHGGVKGGADKAAAHTGIVTRLADQQSACQTCHTDDWQPKLAAYTAAIAAHPGGSTTSPGSSSPSSQAPGSPSAAKGSPLGNWILIGVILTVSGGGGSYVYLNERKLRSQAAPDGSIPQAPAPAPDVETDPSLAALQGRLSGLSADGLDALDILLDDPARAEQVFLSLAEMDEAEYRRFCAELRRTHPPEDGAKQ